MYEYNWSVPALNSHHTAQEALTSVHYSMYEYNWSRACTEQPPRGTGGFHLCTLLYVRIKLIPCLHWTATTRHRRLSPHSSRTDCTQQQQQACIIISSHRRRIYTEENVKVVVAAWGTELLQFLAALAILHQGELNNRMICTLFFNSYWCKIAIAARKWSRKQRRPFPFLLCKSFFYWTFLPFYGHFHPVW